MCRPLLARLHGVRVFEGGLLDKHTHIPWVILVRSPLCLPSAPFCFNALMLSDEPWLVLIGVQSLPTFSLSPTSLDGWLVTTTSSPCVIPGIMPPL